MWRKLSTEELMLLNCGVGEDSWESLELQGDPTSPSSRGSVLGVHWKDWCWSWNSNNLATWCKELTHWKRPWCCKRLKVGGEGDDWEWNCWMSSQTQWTWVWVDPRSWWWTGRPGVLWFMGSQRIRHIWATELKLTEQMCEIILHCSLICQNNLEKGQSWKFQLSRFQTTSKLQWSKQGTKADIEVNVTKQRTQK